MKRTLAIVLLLLGGLVSFAQEDVLPVPSRNTKSYLIADYAEKDAAFLKKKCRQAGLDLGLSVLANRVPTNSKHVSPKPSKHLLKQGVLHLQLPIDEQQTEFAVYHSELFDQPATINVLQIDDELVTYRTTEKTGNIHLFYHCVRGAFGTKKAAHGRNATVYKLWDTPESTLLHDLELQDKMAQTVAKECAKKDYDLLIFNDLKSYAYNEQGDEAIGHFLDTMRKYNPDKLLQADLLTPISSLYLDRINENQMWNESMRTKIVETLTEKQDFYSKNLMPWMLGNFQIHLADKNKPATTLEEMEWLLSKAAAFDAGFGLDFSAETMRKHGLTEELLNTINHWETLRLAHAFSEAQKEQFKDPYANWRINKQNDSTYLLFEIQTSRRYNCESTIYRCDPKSLKRDEIPFSENGIKPKKHPDGTFDSWGQMHGNWNWKSLYNSPLQLMVTVEGKGCINDLCITSTWGKLAIPCTVKAGQILTFEACPIVTDHNFNVIERCESEGQIRLMEGDNLVSFSCSFVGEREKTPEVTVRYITRGETEEIKIP